MPPSSPTSRVLGSRLKAAATVAATGTVTLAVLVGMPALLWRLLGTPWPEPATSWQDFTDRLAQPVTDPMVVELLGLFAWACWAAFLISLAREAAWYAAHVPQLLRDRRLHHQHLAGLPRHQVLVALCVGTLVIALLTVLRPPEASATASHSSADLHGLRLVAATAPLQVTDVKETPAPPTGGTNSPAADAPRAASDEGQWFEYTVVQDDTLWDIAHAHLGDPLKWPRIYGLNKNRLQADGRRLTDPDLLHPGWRLRRHLIWLGKLPVMVGIVERLVPDELWELFQRVVPEAPSRPQGGGRRRHGDREVLAAIVFVATSGCTWQQLPTASFGPSGATAHRRFTEWTKARVWAKLHRLVLDELGSRGQLDWSRCAVDSVNMRALKRGS